jgi:AraC family transcriptional regulator
VREQQGGGREVAQSARTVGTDGVRVVTIGAMVRADRLNQILEAIEQSLDEPDCDGDALAARLFLSRFHFSRIASAALGEAPGAFRRRILLERAAHRLVATSDSVIEVGFDAGYVSPDSFGRAFQRAYGASPSSYRRSASSRHDLASPSEIHFHPPGGLRLPGPDRSTEMHVLVRMVDHHLTLLTDIVERVARVDSGVADRRIELSVEGIDANPTLRGLIDRMVGQLEMWVAAVEGHEQIPRHCDVTPEGLNRRLRSVGPRFRGLAVSALDAGRADEAFIDATCDPPQTFTYGGMLAHVLTFSAVRRTMAIGALESAGIDDLGAGDPMQFVGGTGDDATTIRRRYGPVESA